MTAPKIYEVIREGNKLSFCTNSLVYYKVGFEDFQLLDYRENIINTVMLTITREPPAVRGKSCNHMDRMVGSTIRFILTKYVDENPNIPILFICDTSDGLAAARHKLFQRWCLPFRNKVVKYDSTYRYHQHGFYASMIIRVSHPQHYYIMDAFQQNIDRCFQDDFKPVMDCIVQEENMFPPDYDSFSTN
ncbi:MAG: hypothetical protein JO154_10125 [Chitinophaga sp.]|uniref:DUF6169 family protein n=1 Tax=Chitinophaga sp. TaxID=1869181 RepID=UPI0025BD3F6A|nr:DUF6169 family protein [Chitinophaga sp.]MBV8252950.1 hypothetical protein [Chitinophaga sp.]